MTKYLLMRLSLLAGLIGVGATVAEAQGMSRVDADGDGLLTRAEISAARDRIFDRLDRNGDGSISPDEIAGLQDRIAMRRDMAVNRIGMMAARRDADGDGLISRAEMADGPDLFALIDTNGDDALSREELQRVRSLVLGGRL